MGHQAALLRAVAAGLFVIGLHWRRRRRAAASAAPAQAWPANVKKLKTFRNLGKAVVQASVLGSAARHKRDARHIFDEMDADSNGSVTRDEAAAWLRANPEWANALGIGSSIDMFLAHVDEDETGCISRAEFAAWWGRLQAEEIHHGSSIQIIEPRARRGSPMPVREQTSTASGYGVVRFLAHNRYLFGCLAPDFSHARITPTRLLCVDDPHERRFFVKPEASLRYEFADGSSSGNFLMQLDGFVSPEEARRIVRVGCAIKRASFGEAVAETKPSSSAADGAPLDARMGRSWTLPSSDELIMPSSFFAVGGSNTLTRFGAIAFYQAYPTAWALLERARPWLPTHIVDGERRWRLSTCNPRVRLVSYGDGMGFGMHFDSFRWCLESERDELGLPFTSMRKHNGPAHEKEGLHTFLTLNLYLNDAGAPDATFAGGALVVFAPEADGARSWHDDGSELVEAERALHGDGPYEWRYGEEQVPVTPHAGRMVLFGQGRNGGLAHEAQAISCTHGRMEDFKWILRTDVCYTLCS